MRLRGAIRVDHALSRLTKETGVPYVSMINGHYTYLGDDLHLTENGHQEFGARVAAVLARRYAAHTMAAPRRVAR